MPNEENATAVLNSLADSPPPEAIQELLGAAADYVERAVGVALDFTPDTLPLVDHYLQLARAGTDERPELIPLVVRPVGAYFGEVIRRCVPAFWQVESGDIADWWLCAERIFLAINPMGVAYDALAQGGRHDGPPSTLHVAPEDRAAVEERLKLLPEVPEDEYYLLSTRLEVIQTVADALGARAEAGLGAMVLEWEDYEPLLRSHLGSDLF